MRRHPGGRRQAHRSGHQHHARRRPRAPPAPPQNPSCPELRLLMKRTGSMRSRVGPAVISTRRPASAPLPAAAPRRARRARAARACAPRRLSPQAWSPSAGPEDLHAALRERGHVGARRRVRPHHVIHGRRHGDRRLGRQAQGREQVIGAARPPAARGNPRSPGRSAPHRPSAPARCDPWRPRPPHPTGRCAPCAPRPPGRSSAVTNSRAPAVMTTCTSAPRSRRRRTRSGLL